MDLLEFNLKIRNFFSQHKFKELPATPIFTTNPLQNPNFFLNLKNKCKINSRHIMQTQVMDLSIVPIQTSTSGSLFKQHLVGIIDTSQSPVDFLREFFLYMYQEDFFWEAQETTIDHKILGTSIYGWNLLVDGHKVGFTGYLQKYTNLKIDDVVVFDLDLNFLIEQNKIPLSNCLNGDFSNYLIHHSSKRVLFELFDNYLDEGIWCIKKGLSESGYTFLMNCYNIYQLLIIRGYISKTERIGYDRKISGLIQKCVIG